MVTTTINDVNVSGGAEAPDFGVLTVEALCSGTPVLGGGFEQLNPTFPTTLRFFGSAPTADGQGWRVTYRNPQLFGALGPVSLSVHAICVPTP